MAYVNVTVAKVGRDESKTACGFVQRVPRVLPRIVFLAKTKAVL